tara:strand:+ start:27 stop:1088 length:1062 start_codon:yes stop_codon:yes gene_type:complete
MKSKSPFSKKSPLKLQVYRGDTYESPDTVITRTVGEQVGTAITGLADNAVDYMNTKSERDRKKRDSSGTIATQGLGGGEYKGFGGGMKEINLPETPDVNTNITNPNDFSMFTGSEVPNLTSKSKKVSGGNLPSYAEAYKNDIGGVRTEKGYKNFNAYLEDMKGIKKGDNRDIEREAARTKAMNGSPNKLIGDTMDPYGQPQRGNRDFTFNENEIAPGTLGSQASMGVQKEIYGGGQAQVAAEQLAAEQLQAPLLSKGHADDYEGHTHRKKGKSYEVGEYIDETDFESLNTSLNAYDRGEIQKDKKSQFIVTKNEDYNPTQIDTIRPSEGKQFKMGWGDAERNISTNPKYKKSK